MPHCRAGHLHSSLPPPGKQSSPGKDSRHNLRAISTPDSLDLAKQPGRGQAKLCPDQPELPVAQKHPGSRAIPRQGSTSAQSSQSRPAAGNSLSFLATLPRPPSSSSSSSLGHTPAARCAQGSGIGTAKAFPPAGSCTGSSPRILRGLFPPVAPGKGATATAGEGGAFPPLPPAAQLRLLLPSLGEQPRVCVLTRHPAAPYGSGQGIFSSGGVCAKGILQDWYLITGSSIAF